MDSTNQTESTGRVGRMCLLVGPEGFAFPSVGDPLKHDPEVPNA